MAALSLSIAYASAPATISKDKNKIATVTCKISGAPTKATKYYCEYFLGDKTDTATGNLTSGGTTTFNINVYDYGLTNAIKGKLVVLIKLLEGNSSIATVDNVLDVTIPSWDSPSIGSVTLAPVSYGADTSFGYVQNNSKFEASLNANGVGGSSIKSINMTCSTLKLNKTVSTSGTTLTGSKVISDPLTKSGEHTITFKITDSRGRIAKITKTINVSPYQKPIISKFRVERCTSAGVEDSAGTYAKARAEFSCSSLGGKNTCACTLHYSLRGTRNFTNVGNLTSGVASSAFGNGNFAVGESYDIKIIVTDSVGNSTEKIYTLFGTKYIIDVLDGGTGVGIGCEATTAGQLDVAFNTMFKGQSNTFEKDTTFNNNAIVKGTLSVDNVNTNKDAGITYKSPIVLENTNALYCKDTSGSWAYAISVGENNSANVFSNFTAGNLYVGNKDTTATVIRGKFVQLISGNSGLAIRFNNTALHPDDNGKVHCGWSSQRWLNGYYSGTLYAGSGTINTSDRKVKNDIADMDVALAKDIIMDMKPKTYKFKKDGESHEGKRLKMGFVAQDVHETGLKLNKDLAIYQAHIVDENGELSYYDDSMTNVSDEKLEWGLDYSQIHAPHVRLTQDHENRISEHENRIAKLEETVAKQEDIIKQQAEIIKLLQTQLGMTNSENK